MSLVQIIALCLFTAVLTLVIMEGLASYVLSFRQRGTVLWATGRKRSTHDPYLGWINKPNTHIPDMYGADGHLRINRQGFRNNHDFDRVVADGRIRVICSGASMTFGEGVSNDQTWCQLLESLDARFEPLNMGQTGYGLDQAYLWYKRDGLRFAHQVHLLAFTTNLLHRMQTAVFAGYTKPVLDVENGRLVVTNVPVPRRSYYLTWLTRQVRSLNQLRTIEFVSKAWRKLRVDATGEVEASEAGNKKARDVLRKMLEELRALSDERSIQTVLVYLPSLRELRGDDSQEWMEFMKSESNAFGIPLLDVLSDFRRLPVHEAVRMFIPQGQPGTDHFNDQGNAFVARVIYEKLRSHPSIAHRVFSHERERAGA